MKRIEEIMDRIIEVLALLFTGRWRPMEPGEGD